MKRRNRKNLAEVARWILFAGIVIGITFGVLPEAFRKADCAEAQRMIRFYSVGELTAAEANRLKAAHRMKAAACREETK